MRQDKNRHGELRSHAGWFYTLKIFPGMVCTKRVMNDDGVARHECDNSFSTFDMAGLHTFPLLPSVKTVADCF